MKSKVLLIGLVFVALAIFSAPFLDAAPKPGKGPCDPQVTCTVYEDRDNDGISARYSETICGSHCGPYNPPPYPNSPDCDDQDPAIKNVSSPSCDEDHDGEINYSAYDKSSSTSYSPGDTTKGGKVLDCNDNNKSMNSNSVWYKDSDDDLYYSKNKTQCQKPGPGWTLDLNNNLKGGGDCDDSDDDRYPGNKEVCDNKDNDCNKKSNGKTMSTNIDEGLTCSTTSSFHWENSSGKISSIGIKDAGKSVDMVADYSSDPGSSLNFDVYEVGGSNALKSFSGVNVNSPSSDPYAKKSFEINQSFMSKLSGSSPYKVYFNASYGSNKVNKSKPLKITNNSIKSLTCRGAGYKCMNKSSGCGNVKNFRGCKKGEICCKPVNDSMCGDVSACSDYNNSQRCESNSCNAEPDNVAGCTGSNCGCSWDSNDSTCYFEKNRSDNPNTNGDGTCYYEDGTSGSCGKDGKLNHSWTAKKYVNSTGTYGPKKASSICDPGYDITTCPSVAKLPAENGFTIPLTILALTLAYVFYWNRREE